MCKNWREKGSCRYGDKCLFAHGDQELTKKSPPSSPAKTKPVVLEKEVSVVETNQQAKLLTPVKSNIS